MSWQLTEFADAAERELDRRYRAVIITLYNNLIRLSPVDTGRYRNNHIISIGKPEYNVDVRGAVITEIPRGKYPPVYIQNNLPYAAVIEYGGYPNPPKKGTKTTGGYSKQAPRGVYNVAFLSTVAQFT